MNSLIFKALTLVLILLLGLWFALLWDVGGITDHISQLLMHIDRGSIGAD